MPPAWPIWRYSWQNYKHVQLIIEGGSSKADWLFLSSSFGELRRFSTKGFHPLFHSEKEISELLEADEHIRAIKAQTEKIHYYGAGCSTEALKQQVQRGISAVFPKAKIYVGHDLEAAAFATYRGMSEIACILGTGSNACHFDGKVQSQIRPSLGYILGDEGSGGYFGKALLRAFMYHMLPPELEADFKQQYEWERGAILRHVYAQPNANVYFAGFTHFLAKHAGHSFVISLLEKGFSEFLETHVRCYSTESYSEVNFVGSVAWNFRVHLQNAAKKMDIRIGHILERPIDGLADFHKNYPELVPEGV